MLRHGKILEMTSHELYGREFTPAFHRRTLPSRLARDPSSAGSSHDPEILGDVSRVDSTM